MSLWAGGIHTHSFIPCFVLHAILPNQHRFRIPRALEGLWDEFFVVASILTQAIPRCGCEWPCMLAEEQGAQPRSAEAVGQRQPISIGPDAKQKAKVADRFGRGPDADTQSERDRER